jgi:uncharacterized protein (TIGR03435 family)
MKRSYLCYLVFAAICVPLAGQTPTFEVASVKRAAPIETLIIKGINPGIVIRGHRFLCHDRMISIIQAAYRVNELQVIGPEKAKNHRYQIDAIIPQDANKEMVPVLLQNLLQDRFGLKVHREKRVLPAYVLSVSSTGPLIEVVKKANSTAPAKTYDIVNLNNFEKGDSAEISATSLPSPVTFKTEGKSTIITTPGIGAVRLNALGGTSKIEIMETTIPTFVEWLESLIGRPVIDKTGLKGSYHFTVEILPEELLSALQRTTSSSDNANSPFGPNRNFSNTDSQALGSASNPSGAKIFSSIKKLGLTLVAKKEPVEVLIIDHIEEDPSEN